MVAPFTVHRSSFPVHRSPFPVHRSPFPVHRLQVQSYNMKKAARDLARINEFCNYTCVKH